MRVTSRRFRDLFSYDSLLYLCLMPDKSRQQMDASKTIIQNRHLLIERSGILHQDMAFQRTTNLSNNSWLWRIVATSNHGKGDHTRFSTVLFAIRVFAQISELGLFTREDEKNWRFGKNFPHLAYFLNWFSKNGQSWRSVIATHGYAPVKLILS